jgi:hypothetical protein
MHFSDKYLEAKFLISESKKITRIDNSLYELPLNARIM